MKRNKKKITSKKMMKTSNRNMKPSNSKITVNKKRSPKARKSLNNVELWNRREQELRMYAQGMTTYQIGDYFGISHVQVIADLKAIAALEKPIKARHEIEKVFNDIIKDLQQRLVKSDNDEAPALIKELIEVNTRKAKLLGIYQDTQIANFINNKNITKDPGSNGYEGMSESDLITEFKRRSKVNGI